MASKAEADGNVVETRDDEEGQEDESYVARNSSI